MKLWGRPSPRGCPRLPRRNLAWLLCCNFRTGLAPDFLMCRGRRPIVPGAREKLAMFCQVFIPYCEMRVRVNSVIPLCHRWSRLCLSDYIFRCKSEERLRLEWLESRNVLFIRGISKCISICVSGLFWPSSAFLFFSISHFFCSFEIYEKGADISGLSTVRILENGIERWR